MVIKRFAFLFLLLIISGPVTLRADPWAGPHSLHPVTSDVILGPTPGMIFSSSTLFKASGSGEKSVFPFDMILNFYTRHITTLNGVSCRYYPTCSQYAKGAIRRYGILTGMVMGAERLMRCHEYQTDDLYDPVQLW